MGHAPSRKSGFAGIIEAMFDRPVQACSAARPRPDRAAVRRLFALVVASLLVALAGCTLVKLKQDSTVYYASTVLVGRIDCPAGWHGPLVVAAYTQAGERIHIAHQTLLHECGSYELIVPKGRYALIAFGDANGNATFDRGEPAGAYAGSSEVEAADNGVVAGLDFALTASSDLPVANGTRFDAPDAPDHSTQVGAIADLDAAAFSADNGRRGYWAPVDTFRRGTGNIHFLEPFDAHKIPILFVHGAAGSAQDWRYVVEHLDRRRYQPWIFQYPSGASIDSMAYLLYWKLLNLRARHRFDTLVITAHSMGGLVSRQFLLNFGPQFPEVKLFVSLSTPWAGEASAELGVQHSPAVVPSWIDMQPEGAFMQALFARHLPAKIPYVLFFGHKGGYSLLRPNTDGTVTLASELRPEAQAEAQRVYGFDEDHEGILSSPQVLRQFQAVVDAATDASASGPAPGGLHLSIVLPGAPSPPPGLQPQLLLYPVSQENGDKRPPLAISVPVSSPARPVGPIPPGLYDARVLANAYRTEPAAQRVHIQPGLSPVLHFQLHPQGVLNGYVGAERSAVEIPAGHYRPPDPVVAISRIVLTGAGVQRTLVPRQVGDTDLLASYLDGRDDAFKAQFSFVGLSAGDYELELLADGYLPHRSHHRVVPGQTGPIRPIVLTRKP